MQKYKSYDINAIGCLNDDYRYDNMKMALG